MRLGGFFGVLNCVHEIAGFSRLGLSLALQDFGKRNVAAVEFLGQLVVLIQFSAIQGCSDERTLAGRVS